MKKCSEPGCTNPPFNEFCKYHQFRLYMKGERLYKPKKKKSIIPKESTKRKKEHKRYLELIKELEQETRNQNNGKIYCFFTGQEIMGLVTWHHLRKRTGKFYLDKEFMVPCLNEPHLDYHFKSIEWLIKQEWYPQFMARLRLKDSYSYQNQKKKEDKIEDLF